MSQVVRDYQSEYAHVSRGTECPAPPVFETAGVFDDVVEVLDLHATGVSLFPRGGSEGDLLVGVQLFHGDGDCSFAAVFIFYGSDVGDVAFAGGFAAAAGPGVGGDPSGVPSRFPLPFLSFWLVERKCVASSPTQSGALVDP